MDVLASVPWLGMQYDIGAANKLSAKLGVYSRPALVIMSQTGAVINRNARAVIEEDTLGYSFPWTPHIVQTLDKMDDLNSSTVLVILADGCRLDQVATLTDRLDCLGKDWAYRARTLYVEAVFIPFSILFFFNLFFFLFFSTRSPANLITGLGTALPFMLTCAILMTSCCTLKAATEKNLPTCSRSHGLAINWRLPYARRAACQIRQSWHRLPSSWTCGTTVPIIWAR